MHTIKALFLLPILHESGVALSPTEERVFFPHFSPIFFFSRNKGGHSFFPTVLWPVSKFFLGDSSSRRRVAKKGEGKKNLCGGRIAEVREREGERERESGKLATGVAVLLVAFHHLLVLSPDWKANESCSRPVV